MKINKENFGRYVIDYYDGLLSEKEIQELLLFLDRHPELKAGFDHFRELPELTPEPVAFSRKETLKKPVITATDTLHEENYRQYFVLDLDGELSPEEQKTLEHFRKVNPSLSTEYRQFALARVTPDKKIVFPHKAALKRRPLLPLWRYAGWVAAALLLLFFGFRFLFPGHRKASPLKPVPVAVSGKAQPAQSIPLAQAREKAVLKAKKKATKKRKKPAVGKKQQKKTFSPDILLRYPPVKQLAAADAGFRQITPADYFPLRFPPEKEQQETLALSGPVIIDQSKHHRLINESLARPLTKLTALFVRHKKNKKQYKDHGFVKVLEQGVNVAHILTGNEVALVKTYDDNGNLIDYQLLSDNFHINHRIKNPESR